MNIDDLYSDIQEMEDDWDKLTPLEKNQLEQMNRIAYLYDNDDREECQKEIDDHRERYGFKINIL